ncbi:hypothetical protein DXC58_09355 [Ruminococcus sp. TF06-23]|nr:hypothetical protein DXC58_09355 [Ruminococcus sp. TF06-23]
MIGRGSGKAPSAFFFRISLFNLQYLLQYKYGQQEKLSIIIPFVFGHSQGSELTVGVFFAFELR